MGRPRRNFKSDCIYLVRNFCANYEARFLPQEAIKKAIVGLLCKYANQYGIEIFGFIFMRSYFEILLRGPEQTIHRFMHGFQGDLARTLNALQGTHGSVFPQRYTDEIGRAHV